MPGERLAPLVMFCVIFLALTLLMISTLGQLFMSNATSSPDTTTDWIMIGGKQYDMWNTQPSPGGADNWTVSGINTTEFGQWYSSGLWKKEHHPGDPYSNADDALNAMAHFSFYDPKADPMSHHRVDIWVVRNNTNWQTYSEFRYSTDQFRRATYNMDFLFFREYAYSGAWYGGHEHWYGEMGYTKLNYGENYTYAVASFFGKDKFNITIFLFPSPGQNLTAGLESNHFVLNAANDIFNVNIGGKIGMLNIISALFTFQTDDIGIPNPIGYFISIPIWIATAFTVVGIVSRFFPTIPGF